MYRLFRFRSQINNGCPQIVSIDRSLISKFKNSNSPGCLNVQLWIRFRSTSSESIQTKNLSKTKQFKKNIKQFAEVVQVTNGITSQSKVKVKHLKPNQVHKMVACKKTLAMFPKTTKKRNNSSIETTFNLDKDCLKEELLDNIDELNEDQIKLLKDSELLQTISMTEIDIENKFVSDHIKEQETVDIYNSLKTSNEDKLSNKEHNRKLFAKNKQELKKKIKQLNIKGREKSLNQTLLAYIDLCVCCGFLNRGFAALNNYCNKSLSNKVPLKITDIRIFTCLMHGFASKGNYEKLKEIWSLLELSQLKPDIQVYAAAFECLINKKETCSTDALRDLAKQFFSDGFLYNDLIEKCVFIGNQREQVLKAIRLLDPSFEPHIKIENMYYSCSLLNHLNTQQFTFKCPAEGLLSEKKIHELARKQLEMETSTVIKIKSVNNKSPPQQAILQWHRLEQTQKQEIYPSLDALNQLASIPWTI